MLDDNQYGWLLKESRHAGRSMGSLIRGLIDAALDKASNRKRRYKLSDTSGMFRQTNTRGRDHDQYIYGNK